MKGEESFRAIDALALCRAPVACHYHDGGNPCALRQFFRQHHVNGYSHAVTHGQVQGLDRDLFVLRLDFVLREGRHGLRADQRVGAEREEAGEEEEKGGDCRELLSKSQLT